MRPLEPRPDRPDQVASRGPLSDAEVVARSRAGDQGPLESQHAVMIAVIVVGDEPDRRL